MINKEGIIFGIDPRRGVMRDLVFLSEQRKNIIPILADANHPEEYVERVSGADIVYQDIAQKNQDRDIHQELQIIPEERRLRAAGSQSAQHRCQTKIKRPFHRSQDTAGKRIHGY